MHVADQERLTRFAITGIEQALGHVDRLEPTDYDSALDTFEHHAREAIHALREWAKANDIETREGMLT